MIWELLRLWRTRQRGASLKALVASDFYRLSSAAALLGLSNGVLYAIHGSWAYTTAFTRGLESLNGTAPGPPAIGWGLFAAVLAGMAVSALQKRSFRLDWRPTRAWAANLGGGFLMGLGTGLAAGGNDDLLFHGIPGLSPHAPRSTSR